MAICLTVSANGSTQFEFKQVKESDVTKGTKKDYTNEFIHGCFAGKSSTYVPAGHTCPVKGRGIINGGANWNRTKLESKTTPPREQRSSRPDGND